jgi:antitoxin component YwqK of YwqJK toxin-antitoxin module
MSFANYIENKLNKEFLKYYSNGQLNSKEYFNLEKPNGISNGYYEGGAKMWKKKFSNGRVIREKYWDENGNRIPAQQAYQIWMQKYPCS